MFRELIPALSDRFHIVAPDLPGFGQSDMPPHDEFSYTFAKLAEVIEHFTEGLGLVRFAIYVFDYGAPTGFRLAVRHPERVIAIISQNGNAYRSRAERRLESHPDLLAGRFSGQPRRTSYLPHPRNNFLAVHSRCVRRNPCVSGRLFTRQFLFGWARRP
jgi:pimeloyl-ACP methyl ester carboxylesterase